MFYGRRRVLLCRATANTPIAEGEVFVPNALAAIARRYLRATGRRNMQRIDAVIEYTAIATTNNKKWPTYLRFQLLATRLALSVLRCDAFLLPFSLQLRFDGLVLCLGIFEDLFRTTTAAAGTLRCRRCCGRGRGRGRGCRCVRFAFCITARSRLFLRRGTAVKYSQRGIHPQQVSPQRRGTSPTRRGIGSAVGGHRRLRRMRRKCAHRCCVGGEVQDVLVECICVRVDGGCEI